MARLPSIRRNRPLCRHSSETSHVLIEGELTYREFERTVESETGAINVQWPVTEIVVESIKTLDRKKKDSTEREGAA